jgi:Na+-translocating ferredoxin:NAD+ oxidoreductase RnfD subunit
VSRTQARLPCIVYPKPSDPRLLQIGILATFALLGKLLLSFQVSWLQICAAVLSVAVLDTALAYRESGAVIAPASGLISGLSLGLLLRSPYVWPFVLAGVATVLAKHVIRVRSRHVFNPSNFGLVVALAVPWTEGRVTPGQWGKSWVMLFLILNLGFFIIYKVRRLHLVAAFAASFAFFGLARSTLGVSSVYSLYAFVVSGSFLLFTFFMITDPKTSPDSVRGRVVYAVAVAAVDAVLRAFGVPYSLFLALVAVCAAYAFVRLGRENASTEQVWRTATTGEARPNL